MASPAPQSSSPARPRLVAAGLLLLAALASPAAALSAPATAAGHTVTADLAPAGGATARGTAVLATGGDGTAVRLKLTGLAPGARYVAQVHGGSCAQPGASLAPLATLSAEAGGLALGGGPVRFRGAEPVALEALTDGGHIVAVHGDAGVAACGPIPRLVGAPGPLPSALPATGAGGTVGRAQPAPPADGGCRFVLGFQAIHDLIPDTVGRCLDDEGHNPANGDGLQHAAGGLLVWRKADNWTAFTDGFRTWVNGPHGLEQRLNTQRFPWEANPEGWPVVAAGPITAPPAGGPGAGDPGLLYTVLEGPGNGALSDDTVAIAGPDGIARAKARFAPRAVPFNSNALPLLQPEARVDAGGRVYYADGAGVVRLLAPGQAPRQVATFPLTSIRQELSFAVSADGGRLVAAVVTRPPAAAPGEAIVGFAPGVPWRIELLSAPAGGAARTLWARDIPADQVVGADGSSRLLNLVGWDRSGPVAVVDTLLGHQNPLAGRGWVGHLAHLDLDSSAQPGPVLGGPDCWALALLPGGTIACEGAPLRGDVSIRSAAGAVLWRLPALPANSVRGWFALSPDGSRLAVAEGVGDAQTPRSVLYGRDGSLTRLPDGFLPQGWLDVATLIGARGEVFADRVPLPLALVHLDAPRALDDLGFAGLYVGAAAAGDR